ncbi:trypsin-like peptidase domain-containing protein [Brevibacillus humidisoli]|uniref:S1C family serine protease n=1 Tax=Brevibacillus humidisoli TaxID=2895522 RepID=UPI001E445CA5|nr:trypsin-like peptidase domain-containing protein [Brevibacillus humidisoli]UFJ40413.1 trypsin-like peptidase domain-containing protein [Brevibacillus humidisoli]
MGFYDDDMYQVQRKKRRDSGIGRLILTSITSAVIGGLVVLLMLPTLSKAGYISMIQPNLAFAKDEGDAVTAANTANTVVQPVSLSVESATVEAVERVEEAIVGVINIRRVTNFWTQQTGTVEGGQGSGVIYEKKNGKAHIVTNYHVIDGAERVEVSLPNGDKVEAKILGADPYTDMAVLEIDGSAVTTVAELGNSDTLKVGEPAIAIGNPLGLEFSRTVTQGIVSGVDRSMPVDLNSDGETDWELDVIQTDAAINPGNSGGALLNIQGQVIGINTLKIAREDVEGLGFAIPINDVKKITKQLVEDGKLKRGYLGIVPRDLTTIPRYAWKQELHLPDEVKAGVLIWQIEEFTPAAKAGLRQYDVIVKLDDQEITSGAQLRKYLTLEKTAGQQVEVSYYRDGFLKTATVTLGEQGQ